MVLVVFGYGGGVRVKLVKRVFGLDRVILGMKLVLLGTPVIGWAFATMEIQENFVILKNDTEICHQIKFA